MDSLLNLIFFNGAEIIYVGIILFALFIYIGFFDMNKFVDDNKALFSKLMESDFEFYLRSQYGDNAKVEERFQKRVKTGIVSFLLTFLVLMVSGDSLNFPIKVVICVGVTYFMYKSDYSNLKSQYKKNLHNINLKLPYYLKSLEILIQHYTVPVAITKSIDSAPEMFKPGLKDLIAAIDSGDSSIEPYMEFARRYPVRDSMRMMRLLYRLGLGSQERKQEQLITFSRTISNLQSKSRETKYKERLEAMEKKTMTMLVATGGGVIVILLIAIMQMFGAA